ncbi:MAG: nucleotidyltransferase domain-containing protein [Candidatus Omnitrophica bacterium]|nr:nucleotidyltransferase domain-containing protein [Candidatus Omnitrophota bacterium]
MRTDVLPLYLTKSRARGDLLALFFLNPQASYYLREMERRLRHSAGTLARELTRFSQEGLLHREARGKEVFYRLNRSHPLYAEIKGIIEKTRGIPVRLADGLQPIKSVQQAFIYGSFAKGTPAANSDIDLLLIGKETPASKKFLGDLEARFGRTINVTAYAPAEFEAKRRDRSEFLFEVMRGPLIQLKPESSHGPAQAA